VIRLSSVLSCITVILNVMFAPTAIGIFFSNYEFPECLIFLPPQKDRDFERD